MITQLQKELGDFKKSYSLRRDAVETSNKVFSSDKSENYLYNQSAVIDTVDHYFRSEFAKSRFDDEGQRMIFINQLQFPVRVARKQVDIDVKDAIFVPDTYEDAKKIRYAKRQFQDFAKESKLGTVINLLLDDYAKYGSCVYKRVGDLIERCPIHNIINSQNADSLKQAATSGGYVILKNEMYLGEMQEFPDWDLSDLELKHDEQYTTYERYGLITGKELRDYGIDSDLEDEETTFSMTMFVDGGNNIVNVFTEVIDPDDFPLGEAHWERQYGRWLGVGEGENQFENQVAKNLASNLRRRALLWGAKKIFQSSDNDKSDLNLIKEVRDGTVLEVGRDGAITQVNGQTQHLGDFQSFDNLVDQNSQQKSFTFESVTGESMASGTPFRLGVILSQATNSHFNLKKEVFAEMLNDMFFNHITEIFKDYPKKKKIAYASDEEGVDELRESIVEYNADKLLLDNLLKKPVPELLGMSFDKEKIKNEMRAQVEKEPYFFVNVPDSYYDDLKFAMVVEVTGQYTNVEKEVETLTSILTLALQNPQALDDPRISKMIELIGAKTGQSLKGVLGGVAQKSPELAGLANDALTAQITSQNEGANQAQAPAVAG